MRNFTITTQHTYHISFDEEELAQQLTSVTTDSVRPIMKAAEMVVRRYRSQFNHETVGTVTKRDLLDAGVLGDLIYYLRPDVDLDRVTFFFDVLDHSWTEEVLEA